MINRKQRVNYVRSCALSKLYKYQLKFKSMPIVHTKKRKSSKCIVKHVLASLDNKEELKQLHKKFKSNSVI